MHENGATFPVFLIVELATVAVELTNDGRKAECAVMDVHEVDTPLVRLGILETKCLRLDAKVLLSIADVEFFEIGIAIEDLLVVRDAVVFNPGIRPYQTIRKPANVRFPVTDEEVEIVGSVPLRSGQHRC